MMEGAIVSCKSVQRLYQISTPILNCIYVGLKLIQGDTGSSSKSRSNSIKLVCTGQMGNEDTTVASLSNRTLTATEKCTVLLSLAV